MKQFFYCASVLTALLALTGCQEQKVSSTTVRSTNEFVRTVDVDHFVVEDNTDKPWFSSYETQDRFEELILLFEKSDLDYRGYLPAYSEPAQAQRAITLQIGERQVSVYFYNPNNIKQKDRLKLVKEEKKLYLFGRPFDAVVNGQYVLIDSATHRDGDAIVKVFKKL